MPRRQNKSKKKRLRRGSSGEEEECNDDHHQPLSLEEDLRRQRIRQHERQKLKEEKEEQSKKDKTNDGNDETDDNHDVGFVMPFQSSTSTSTSTTKSQLILNNNGETMIRLPSSSFLLSHIIQSDPMLTIQKRNTLRQLWPTQYHFENMIINPKAAALYCKKKWLMKHTLPDNSTMCSWDLSCKYRLHTSARTFDVAMLSNTNTNTNTNTSINTTNATTTNSSSNTQPQLPTIATIFHDGWGLFHHKKSHHDHRIQTIQSPPVHAIRIHENSSLCGTIVRNYNSSSNNNNNNNSYLFRWYKLPHATSYIEADLQHPVTDFCFGNEIAIFSCPRYRNGNNLNPLFLPLVEAGGDYNTNNNYISSTVRTINVQNFPQSDALRVEMMCKEQEKIVAFGHRNGQVSILDLRVS
jgi:hypothetical protein